METVGLFAGIGGIELGLQRSGHDTSLLCEIDHGAQAVLRHHFPDVRVCDDIRNLKALPRSTELITAGFPCQDLSQAGKTAGITGHRSGLVGDVFRLIERRPVPWVLLENVPFMLQLNKGRALDVIVSAFERLGYSWAYRIVDTRAFGLPQRRERVFFLASLEGDPRDVLFADDAEAPPADAWKAGEAFGFYWTEGIRGLGAAVGAIPTLKGGSTIGIPSAPAILLADGKVVTPDLRDAERLQGFAADWTKPAEECVRTSFRWKLVGNAVTVDVAEWVGSRLAEPGRYEAGSDRPLRPGESWPRAAWNVGQTRCASAVSAWPLRKRTARIDRFLKFPPKSLSVRATAGFLSRARTSKLRFPEGFLDAVELHLDRASQLDAIGTRVKRRTALSA